MGQRGDGVTASNVLSKKKSLPLIYTLENCSVAVKREIGNAYMKRVLDPADLGRVVAIMEETGAREHAQQQARQLVGEANELLQSPSLAIGGGRPVEALLAAAVEPLAMTT